MSEPIVTECAHCGDWITQLPEGAAGAGTWIHSDRLGVEDHGEGCDWRPVATPWTPYQRPRPVADNRQETP